MCTWESFLFSFVKYSHLMLTTSSSTVLKTSSMFSIKVSAVTAVLLILLQASLIRCAHIPVGFLSPWRAPSHVSDTNEQFVKREITPEERQYLDGLANSYKGIFWDVAYPGAGNEGGGCTVNSTLSFASHLHG
jgi:hypothetical protein